MKSSVIGGAAALMLAAAAFAQPAATDLGSITPPSTTSSSGEVAPAGVIWFQVTIPAISAANWMEIDSAGTAYDTEIGFFNANGDLIADDDDSGPGLQSGLSFGLGSGGPIGGTGGTLGGGQDGVNLPAGTYYISASAFNSTFGNGFTVTSAATVSGNFILNIVTGIAPPPPPGSWNETVDGGGDAGELINSAQAITGSGPLTAIIGGFAASDSDMYAINICDAAAFNATTVGGTGVDTQLFLFDTTGLGISFNDDSTALQSTLTNTYVTGNGNYFLAVSRYDRDPVDAAGNALWLDTPFNVERAPDGPGAAGTIAGWIGTNTGSAAYTLTLTGVCRGSGGPVCIADVDDGSSTGTRDGAVTLEDLLYYISIYDQGVLAADVDNGTFTGTRDGGVTIDDLLYYLSRYDSGC